MPDESTSHEHMLCPNHEHGSSSVHDHGGFPFRFQLSNIPPRLKAPPSPQGHNPVTVLFENP